MKRRLTAQPVAGLRRLICKARATGSPRPSHPMAVALRALPAVLALTAWPAAAQDEVPFITTPDAVTLAMLDLARVGPQDRLIDLGSGDGRIVITAARRFGARGLGVEIVPDLVALSRRNAQAAGVADRPSLRCRTCSRPTCPAPRSSRCTC